MKKPPYCKKFTWLPVVLLMLVTGVICQSRSYAQSEKEFLESIGDDLKSEEKKKKELEAKEKEYDKIKDDADKALKKEKFDEAEKLYRQMNKIFPERDYPEIQIRLVKQERERKEREELDRNYQAAIDEGNKHLEKQSWDNAKSEFQKALKLKPDEQLAKNKLKEIVKLKEEEEKRRLEKQRQEKYEEFIAAGDKALSANEFEEARKHYKAAVNVKSDEKYPKDQLIEVSKREREEEERKKQELLDAKYQTIIERADGLLKDQKWDEAKSEYQKAAQLKPGEKYPKEKMTEAEKLKAEEEERKEREALNARYQNIIEEADKLFNAEKWDEAVAKYKEAAEVKRGEEYPGKQIAKAEEAEARAEREAEEAAKRAEIRAEYDALIAEADKLFGSDRYEEAIVKYKEAAAVKGDEEYPAEKIAEAQNAVEEAKRRAEKEERTAQFEQLFKEGEQLAAAEKWDEAIAKFEAADKVWPEDKRAAEKAAETRKAKEEFVKAQKEAEAVQAAFDEAMDEGKRAVQNGEWDRAVEAYKKAVEVKPDNRDAREKLAQTEQSKKFAESAEKKEAERERQERAKRDKYDALIKTGDEALSAENWAEAKSNYEQAAELFPEEPYPNRQTAEIEKLKKAKEEERRRAREAAEKEAQELEERYEGLIAQAEDAAELKEWEAARSYLEQAKELKPTSEKPDRMLDGVKHKIAEEESKRKRERELAEKEEAKSEQFRETLEKADRALEKDEFTDAISLYRQAADLQPENTEIDAKIAEARSRMEALKEEAERKRKEEEEKLAELNRKYSELMGKGESEVQKKNWTEAKSYFKQAQQVKPSAAGPRERIDDVERLIRMEESEQRERDRAEREKREREEEFDALIASADEALGNEDWPNAKALYRKALDVKPDEEYPKEQIKKVDIIREKTERAEREKAVEENYKESMRQGDIALNEKDFDAAIRAFSSALQVKEESEEAASKLEEARERKLKFEAERAKARETEIAEAREEARRRADEQKKKREEQRRERIERIQADKPESLANKYPEGVSHEVVDQGHRVVKKTVVVESGEGRKLIKLTYPWGQEFYYLNGKRITGDAYHHNIRKYL